MPNLVMYGFVDLQDAWARRVIDVGVDTVFTAIDETVAQHNLVLNEMMSGLVQRTTKFQTNYRTMGTARLQSIDENGRALPVKSGASYTVGWPIYRAATAWGAGFEARLRMTVQQANEQTELMLMADRNWMRDQIFGAIFNATPYTFKDEREGDIGVLPLANGDGQLYYVTGGGSGPIAANHFFAQAAALDDTHNPFGTLYSTLTQYAATNGEVYTLVPTNLMPSIEAMSSFHPLSDSNIQRGSAEDVLVGTLGITTPGVLRGYMNERVWIVEWRQMINNYIVALVAGGDPPLAMREEDIPELQGFTLASEEGEHFPWWERQYRRKAGFGALNRTAAAILQIGSGTYAVPSGYGLPMP